MNIINMFQEIKNCNKIRKLKTKVEYTIRRFKWWREKHCLTWSDIKQGKDNVIYWFPVVWKDRWWDHSFLYSILRHKLSQMEKGFSGRYAMSANAKKDAADIKKCVMLLDRLIKDDYVNHDTPNPNIRRLFEKEENLIRQDLHLLCKTLEKKSRCWWD